MSHSSWAGQCIQGGHKQVRGCSFCIPHITDCGTQTKALSQPKSEQAAPGTTLHYKYSYLLMPHHSGTEMKPAPTKHTLWVPEVLTVGKEAELKPGSLSKQPCDTFRNLKLLEERTLTKHKSTTGHTGIEWTSYPTPQARFPPLSPDDQMVCVKGKSTGQVSPSISIDVLDLTNKLTSFKFKCTEPSLPTLGWCMWIICVFSEIKTWCCQSKTNIVALSEVTHANSCIKLIKLITISGSTGDINLTLTYE